MPFSKLSKLSFILCCAFITSCASVEKASVWVGEATGNQELIKASADMTPRQEYYLGRSLAAQIMTAQKPIKNQNLVRYVNTMGQYLALHSDRPETFGGYRFAVIEGDDPAAMSAPGGFIFISKGMLTLARTEDELAAVIAHEIGHIEMKHAERNIKASKRLSLGKKIFDMAVKQSENSDNLMIFSKNVAEGLDITYNKGQEIEADSSAVRILTRAGYNANALHDLIERMPASAKVLSRHPRNVSRLKKLQDLTANHQYNGVPQARYKRIAQHKSALPNTQSTAQ